MYFLLKYVLLPVLFTLTQVVLFLITPTFTPVRIQSNLGTTAWPQRPLIFDTHCINKITCICFSQVQRRYVIDQTWHGDPGSEGYRGVVEGNGGSEGKEGIRGGR